MDWGRGLAGPPAVSPLQPESPCLPAVGPAHHEGKPAPSGTVTAVGPGLGGGFSGLYLSHTSNGIRSLRSVSGWVITSLPPRPRPRTLSNECTAFRGLRGTGSGPGLSEHRGDELLRATQRWPPGVPGLWGLHSALSREQTLHGTRGCAPAAATPCSLWSARGSKRPQTGASRDICCSGFGVQSSLPADSVHRNPTLDQVLKLLGPQRDWPTEVGRAHLLQTHSLLG